MNAALLRPAIVASLAFVTQATATDFTKQVLPILNAKCSSCHSEAKGKTKGDFAIDRMDDMKQQVKAGSPDKSSIVVSVTLPDDDEDVMPPKGKNRLTPAEVATLKAWITEGASFTAGAPATAAAPAAGGPKSWTNTAGKTIQAELDRVDGDAVVLKTADGQFYRVPLANLDAASQAQAKQ
jgi:Planctomycete cytochrome C